MVLRRTTPKSEKRGEEEKIMNMDKLPLNTAEPTFTSSPSSPQDQTSQLFTETIHIPKESGHDHKVLYGYVNSEGHMVYADISNALIFDGRSFFQLRGSNVLSRGAVSSHEGQHRETSNNISRSQSRSIRIRINWNQLFGLIFRLFLVFMLFSKSASRLKLYIICGCVILLFL